MRPVSPSAGHDAGRGGAVAGVPGGIEPPSLHRRDLPRAHGTHNHDATDTPFRRGNGLHPAPGRARRAAWRKVNRATIEHFSAQR